MANATTMNPTSVKTNLDEDARALRDRILGALYSATRGTERPVPLAEIRERVGEMSGADFDRIMSHLDREGSIVMDRGADATLVKLPAAGHLFQTVPCTLKDRVLGAICAVARGPVRIASIPEVRARLGDVTPVELERAIVALALQGEIDLGRGAEQGWVRLSPLARTTTMGALAPMMTTAFAPTGWDVPSLSMTHAIHHAHPIHHRAAVEHVARELWEMRGRQPGYDFQNWVEAERIVRLQHGCAHHAPSF